MDLDARPRFRGVCRCIDDVRHAGPSIAEAGRLAGAPDRVSVVHVAPQAAVPLGPERVIGGPGRREGTCSVPVLRGGPSGGSDEPWR